MTERGATVDDLKAEDAAREGADAWRDAFLSALNGAAASDKLISQIIDDASAIADAAVERIAARVTKDSGQ